MSRIQGRARRRMTWLSAGLATVLGASAFWVGSANGNGATGAGSDAAAQVTAFASDDFNRTALGEPWTVVDHVGDGTVSLSGAGTADARLELAVPGGVDHDLWNTNRALRATRPAADTDFTAELKFDSVPALKYQTQGLLVEQDADNWIRFSFHHNGSSIRAYAATTAAGVSTKRFDVVQAGATSLWLRVQRAGDDWTVRTSTDGANWLTKGSFTHTLGVTAVGPLAANSGNPEPANTVLVDYVFEASAPIVPEDTPPSSVTHTLDTSVTGDGAITRAPDLASYPEGTDVTLTAEPQPGAAFAGWSGDLTGGDNPAQITMDADKAVTATFITDTAPPVISGVTVTPSSSSAVVAWTTDEPATSSVAVGTTTAYSHGTFGSSNLTRTHSVTIAGLAPSTTYHYRVSSTDGARLTTNRPDATFATPASSGPAINVWYGDQQTIGGNGQTQLFYNLLGNVSDPQGVAALSYSVNGGADRSLTIGADLRRLQAPGDFNADIPWDDLDPGSNQVVLTARDTPGNVSTRTVVVHRQQGAAPLPYGTDWAAAARIEEQAQVVDGKWGLDGATVRPLELGYDRLLMLGDISWHDYELTVPVTVHGLGPGHNSPNSGAALVGLALNWRGHTQVNREQPFRYWYPTGAFAWYRWASHPKFELRGNDGSPTARQNGQLQFGQTYIFKARSETVSGGVQYSWKIWAQGSPEPSAWTLTIFESDGPATGSVGLISHHTDVQFGNVTVTPL
ncbi:MAG: DUF1349 domain-containing protein [Acidimicrobiales bacterium]